MKKSRSNRSLRELWKISKSVYNESFLEGYLESAGSQREKYVEKLEKNSKSLRRSALVTKILSSVFILVLNIITAQSIGQLQDSIPYISHITFSAYLFAVTTPIIIIFGTNFLFLFTYGIQSTIGVFRGESFKFLKILPLSEKDIQKIVFITFFRTIDLQLICIFLGLPIYTIIFSQNLLAVAVSLIISGINLMFYISLMVIIGNFMANKIFSFDSSSKGKNAMRIVVSVLYMITAMLVGLLFNFIAEFVGSLFNSSLSVGSTGLTINIVLCFIIWPFSLAYIYGLSLFPVEMIIQHFDQSWFLFIGLLLSVVVISLLFRKAMRILGAASLEKELDSGDRESIMPEHIHVETSSPYRAIIEKDKKYFLRNFQSMIYLIMPVLLQVMGVVIMSIYYPEDSIESLSGLTVTEIMYLVMSIIFLIVAVTSAENETGDLLYALPVKNSDVFKAKKRIMVVDLFVAVILTTIILFFITDAVRIYVLISQLTFLVISYYGSCLGLTIYARLFGKLRDKYTLMQLNLDNKSVKQIGGSLLLIVAIITPLLLTLGIGLIIGDASIDVTFYLSQLVIAIILAIIFELIARKTFHRE